MSARLSQCLSICPRVQVRECVAQRCVPILACFCGSLHLFQLLFRLYSIPSIHPQLFHRSSFLPLPFFPHSSSLLCHSSPCPLDRPSVVPTLPIPAPIGRPRPGPYYGWAYLLPWFSYHLLIPQRTDSVQSLHECACCFSCWDSAAAAASAAKEDRRRRRRRSEERAIEPQPERSSHSTIPGRNHLSYCGGQVYDIYTQAPAPPPIQNSTAPTLCSAFLPSTSPATEAAHPSPAGAFHLHVGLL